MNDFNIGKSAIKGITAVTAKSDRAFSKHWHDEYGVGVIDAGAQTSLSGRGIVEAICGNMITVNPAEIHDGKPLGDNGRQWRMLYFDPQLIAGFVEDISHQAKQSFEITAPIIRNDLITKKFNLLYAHATNKGNPARQEELLLGLISDLMTLEKVTDSVVQVPHEITQAIDFMNDEPTHDIQLSDLASVTGLSRFQVLRGVSAATGLTPHAYLVQKRVDLAKILIQQGETLCDAAGLAGFSDQSHLHRIFAKKYGITLGKYARSLR